MRCSLVKKSEHDFLKVEIVPIVQKNKRFYLGRINANDFVKLFTVEPAEYDIVKQTTLASEFPDDEEYYNYLIDEDKERMTDKPFERKESKERVKDILKFLQEEEYAFFPNTIIVTCDIMENNNNNIVTFDQLSSDDTNFLYNSNISFMETTDTNYYLYIPYKEKTLIIIDGQHRIKGLYKWEDDLRNSYELLIIFLIGFDRSVLAKQFYTINYNQKPVNRSLLYHLSGEFSHELNETTFLHEAVKLMNELSNSPFYHRVKMLGTIPPDLSEDDRAYMTISQAFMIDSLLRTITIKGVKRGNYPPIFLVYYQHKEMQIEIIRFIIKYFNAIKEIKANDWDNPKDSIICKTIGFGALLKVLFFIFVKMFTVEWGKEPKKILDLSLDNLITKLDGLDSIDFSVSGEFGGVASGGSLNKLMKRIIENLSYLDELRTANSLTSTNEYRKFIEEYRKQYLNDYKKWLKQNIYVL